MDNNWIKHYIKEKIHYYKKYLSKNPHSVLKDEIENNLQMLKKIFN